MSSEGVTYVEAIRLSLREALLRDERVLVLGEDVGLGGGAFRATAGLQAEFGPERVIDTPISEAAFTGAAVGMALDGLRPVVEFQFADFLTSGMNAIVNTAAKMYFRHRLAVPLVIRAPAAGGFSGGPFHSQNPEVWFLRTPGLKVACPATAEDACTLLAAAISDPNPVLFFEQKSLYTRVKGSFLYDPEAPLQGAVVRREGGDVTIVSYGAALHLALEAATLLADDGIECEVVDLRVLCPLDFPTVVRSVQKTSRCVIAHEDYENYGVGAELAARLVGELFTDLDAPVRRVGARFWPIPFSPPLEQETLPGVVDIVDAVRETASF
ncbi:MAG: 2-oxoisovalerate dehydrogenase subunit beta [Gaiellaceae bacterium]|jgi:2-oxoisovalerate dehydrogenase E1 component beta subunit|nr:MAG: 2-oxoisovalerate dehydrogenase subunit beta [Gaiellaceae bacterium]